MFGFLKLKNRPRKMLFLVLRLSAGLFVLAAGFFLTKHWIGELKTVFRGVAGPFFILAGLIMVAAAKE